MLAVCVGEAGRQAARMFWGKQPTAAFALAGAWASATVRHASRLGGKVAAADFHFDVPKAAGCFGKERECERSCRTTTQWPPSDPRWRRLRSPCTRGNCSACSRAPWASAMPPRNPRRRSLDCSRSLNASIRPHTRLVFAPSLDLMARLCPIASARRKRPGLIPT